MKGISLKRKVCGGLVLLMLLFIWGQSIMPEQKSAQESQWVTENIVEPVVEAVLDVIGHGSSGQKLIVQDGFVRKLAHMTEFCLLSVLLFLLIDRKKKFYWVAFGGFLVAFLDESIQVLSGRGPMIIDVWIDMIGVTVGILIGLGIRSLAEKRQRRK